MIEKNNNEKQNEVKNNGFKQEWIDNPGSVEQWEYQQSRQNPHCIQTSPRAWKRWEMEQELWDE